MSEYIQTPAYPNKMPVDISFVFAEEKPAGKHGFVKADGDVLRFEDGTLARFWGVNFNGGANFPEHGYAEKVARRLAQSGCNIVRFHQLDAEWDTPNIYAYTKGPQVKTTRKLDPVSMDHLDYLIYCLKNEGIYVYFDMMTYRKFKSGDDVPFAEELHDSAKPYSIFDRRLVELQKEFCDQIWNRVNKYTGLAYKDDPVFVMTEITNECDLFSKRPLDSEYYNREYRELLRDWLQKKGLEYDWENCDLLAKEQPLLDFKIEVQMAYYREMRAYMRSLGVKIPITGTNWHQASALVEAQKEMDFVDDHHYFYDWGWGEKEKVTANASILGTPGPLNKVGYMHMNNRPYFISEWDMPWPNQYRAEGPIYYAALSALQDWSGMAIHTYSYGTDMDRFSILGKEMSSSTVGGVPYREGIFATWNDPAKFGLFYHSALIVRRCDITPAAKKIGFTNTDMTKMPNTFTASGVMDEHRIAYVPRGEQAVGCDEVVKDTDSYAPETPNVFCADHGQMWKNTKKKLGGINTPRTQVLYGKLSTGRNGNVQGVEGDLLDDVRVNASTDFGVVALSSLTDDPICRSENMLLTTIGRARNTDAVFDGENLVEFGRAPILSEVIKAKISIRTENKRLQVWGVNAEGYYVGRKEATFEDGWMTFSVGDKFNASYYLIVAE